MSNESLKKLSKQNEEVTSEMSMPNELPQPLTLRLVEDDTASTKLTDSLDEFAPQLPEEIESEFSEILIEQSAEDILIEEPSFDTVEDEQTPIDEKVEDFPIELPPSPVDEKTADEDFEFLTSEDLGNLTLKDFDEEEDDTPLVDKKESIASLNFDESEYSDLTPPPPPFKDPEQEKEIEMIKKKVINDVNGEFTSSNSHINIEITGLNKLDKLAALSKIDQLDEKLDSLSNLNRLLQMNGELFENLPHLHKLDKLKSLSNLEKLDMLSQLDAINQLENLKQLEHLKSLEAISEISKLENLHQLQSLDQLKNLEELQNLSKLQVLSELDKLEGLEKLGHLDQLSKLDDVGLFEKIEKLDKLSIMNRKFHMIFLGECFRFAFEFAKFGLSAIFVLYLLSTHAGQKIATKALSSVGFGSPAQTNFGLMLLQGEMQTPQFEEVLANVKKKIKYDYQRAFSIDNNLSLVERVHLINDVMGYSFIHNGTSIQEETLAALRQQVIYSKSNVMPKIEYDLAIAKHELREADEKMLKELKIFFANGKNLEIIQKYQYSKSNLESLRLALIVATLELYIEDPKTLQSTISL